MWPLIVKDFRRRRRSPLSTVVMLVFPLFMSLTLGALIGDPGAGKKTPPLKILVENRDEKGFISNAIVGALGNGEAAGRLDATLVDVGEGEALMEKGKASALLILPEDFSRDLLERRPTHITVVRNPAEGIYPEIAVQGAGVLSTYLDQGARLLGDDLAAIQEMIDDGHLPPAAKVGEVAAHLMEKAKGLKRYLFPLLVTVHSTKAEKEGAPTFSIIGYILVMTTVMAVLFVAVRSIHDLFEEEKSGMLKRQAASPLGVSRIVTAKLIFGILMGVAVTAILALAGSLLGWIKPPVDVLAVVLLTILFSAAACGVVALIFSVSRSEKQAGILSWLVIMGMSAMGGSLVPLEAMSGMMRRAAPFTVNYWAIEGYKRVLFDGAHTGGIFQVLLVLVVIAALTLVLSGALLSRRLKEIHQ